MNPKKLSWFVKWKTAVAASHFSLCKFGNPLIYILLFSPHGTIPIILNSGAHIENSSNEIYAGL